MNRAAATIFSDRPSVEGLSTIPVTLSQKLQDSGSDNTPLSYRVPGSIPPPLHQQGRSRARTQLESVKNGDEVSLANTDLSSASKKRNRTRTVQSSRLSSICDTDSTHLLKTLLADLTQPHTASIIAPSAQHRQESTTPSSDFYPTHPLEPYLLTTESTLCLGNTFVNERRPKDESLGDGEDQPVAYGQLANSKQSHSLDVLPWIKEVDTVNDLESRIQELEQDCKVRYCITTDRISS